MEDNLIIFNGILYVLIVFDITPGEVGTEFFKEESFLRRATKGGNLMSVFNKSFGEMLADKTSGARDEDFHLVYGHYTL